VWKTCSTSIAQQSKTSLFISICALGDVSSGVSARLHTNGLISVVEARHFKLRILVARQEPRENHHEIGRVREKSPAVFKADDIER
jgi:hypothetical protein